MQTTSEGKTGHCASYNHKRCPYRVGGATENGIALTGGGFYMCTCKCHDKQADAVRDRRMALIENVDDAEPTQFADLDLSEPEPDLEQRPAATIATAEGVVIAEQQHIDIAEAAPKPKAKPAKAGMTTAQKRALNQMMAFHLREMIANWDTLALDWDDLDNVDQATASQQLENHWLRYIDPELNKARREAAAAARKAK